MNEARAVVEPAPPAPVARAGALGIGDDLESTLLAGLADEPEEADGTAFEADPGPAAPTGETAGNPADPPEAGASAARSAPLPVDRLGPEFDNDQPGRAPEADFPRPAPEAPRNGALAPSPDLEAAPDEEPAEPSLESIAARDEPAGRNGSGGPRDERPSAPAPDGPLDGLLDGLLDGPLEDESAPGEDAPAAPSAGGELAVLAFAADPESESALREGLSERPDLQVWPGGLRSAIATLGAGPSPPLLFVDLDEIPYPAGAIQELAAVCEVGTVVVAFGSDGTARFSREVLLAGLSDYLVKPITAAAVREAAARAAALVRAGEAQGPEGGWSVGFAGTGGSGATTLAGAAALLAAERGRYVSVLDLNRTFPALSFLLDVEPAPGLVELLSTVARASLHPEMVDGMRAKRSDRIAVYGYPWSAIPPPLPPVWAICELIVELQRRSHLVIVDGLDDPATRISLLAMVDARVLVVEPTRTGAVCAARMLDRFAPMFDPEWPLHVVQNHTRALKPRTGAEILRDAGVHGAPDVVVPFEPALPGHADRGWPEGRLPRTLRKSLAALVDRILAAPATAPAATLTPA